MASRARKLRGYENPKNRPGHWQRHVVLDVLDNESPDFLDITGDGKPEILCCSSGYMGYAEADWKNPAAALEIPRRLAEGGLSAVHARDWLWRHQRRRTN